MLAKHRQVRLTALNTYLNLLSNFPCCRWSYGEGFWHGRIPPRRQLCCESLRLAFSFAVCSLPFLATFPVSAPFCMPQRGTTGVYSSINSSAGNLPGCLQFHYNLLSPDSWGCLGIGSTVDSLVRGSMLHNRFLMHLIHSACMCTDALSLAYWMHLASVKQGKKHPLLLFISVLDVPICLWNKSWNSKHGAQDTTKIKIYYTTSAISFSQWWYTPGEHQTCV